MRDRVSLTRFMATKTSEQMKNMFFSLENTANPASDCVHPSTGTGRKGCNDTLQLSDVSPDGSTTATRTSYASARKWHVVGLVPCFSTDTYRYCPAIDAPHVCAASWFTY